MVVKWFNLSNGLVSSASCPVSHSFSCGYVDTPRNNLALKEGAAVKICPH